MSENLFDNYIKDKLKDHVSAVPADMWDRIQRKKNKPKGAYWWKYFIVISLLTCTAIFGWFSAAKHIRENETAATNDGIKEIGVSASKGNDAIQSSTSALSDTSNAGDAGNQKKGSQTAINPEEDINLSDESEAQSISRKSKLTAFLRQDDPEQGYSRARGIKSLSAQNQIPAEQSSLFEDKKNYRDRLALLAILDKEKYTTSSNLVYLNNFKTCFSSVDCPSGQKGNRSWFVELYGSPDFAIKKTEASGRTNPAYLNRKDSTESAQVSYTAGMRLSKEIGENMLFKTGLQYSQINEKFTYKHENERTRTTVVTVRTIIRSPGDTIFVTDTSVIEQIGYRAKTTYNRYRSMDVPIILGYEFGGPDWKAQINGGAIINLSSWQQGELLDTSYQPVSFEKANTPLFKKSIGLGLYAGVSLLKSIGDKTDIFAEPYLRYNLSSITGDSSPFNQKFHVAGINLGIRYKLTGRRATK